jgi:DNA-binding MarR family transcriptional regulator
MESLLITFRDKRADLTIGTFGTFLYIARRTTRVLSGQIPILTISDVADQLQISYPTAARHCDLLGAGVGGKGGLGWLRKEQASDKRSKCVMLSDAGVDVLSDAIKRVLY